MCLILTQLLGHGGNGSKSENGWQGRIEILTEQWKRKQPAQREQGGKKLDRRRDGSHARMRRETKRMRTREKESGKGRKKLGWWRKKGISGSRVLTERRARADTRERN